MPITQPSVTLLKERLATGAQALTALCQEQARNDLATDLAPLLERLHKGTFRLVVMGEIKKGKTSFINALLGLGNLLPTDTDIATSTVYKLIYGPERKVKVFFLPDSETGRRPEPLTIPEAQIADYGTEALNPHNQKRVEFIGVEAPAELLKTGLVIVDTPGVGGLFKEHRGITWQFAPNADAVLFVLDSAESPVGADEISFLEELTGKITDRVYFVQTKTDLVGREQWQAWRDRNRALLLEKLPKLSPETLRYFPISPKLKREGDKLRMARVVEDSGYPAVEAFLRDELIAAKDWLLCQETARVLGSKLALLRKDAVAQLQIVQAESRERLAQIEKQLQARRQEFGEWERSAFRDQQRLFSDRFRDLRKEAGDALNDALDPQSGEINDVLNRFRDKGAGAKDLDSEVRNTQQWLVAVSTQRGREVILTLQQKVTEGIRSLCRSVEGHIEPEQFLARLSTCSTRDWGSGVTAHDSLHLTHSAFESVRNTAMGSSFAAGVAMLVGNFLFPGGGLLFGSMIAGATFVGGRMAKEHLDDKRREEALARMERVLRETMAAVRKAALQDFDRLATDAERAIRDLFDAAVQATKDGYEREVQAILESRTRSQAELKSRADTCNALIRRIDGVRTTLTEAAQE